MSEKKFYWLKLKRDFFKRHDIRIIEGLPNGIEMCHFFLKLMLESVDHDGELRFSKDVPYTPEMLATITYTDLSVVQKSIETLTQLKMLEITEDGTIIIDLVKSMTGSAVDNDNANRQRRFRESQKGQALQNVTPSVTQALRKVTHTVTKDNESKSKSKSKSKSIELDRKRNTKEKENPYPTLEDVIAYCQERNSPVNPQTFFDYYQTGNWKDSKGNPVKNWKQKLITWEKQDRTKTRPEPIKSGNEFLKLLETEGDL